MLVTPIQLLAGVGLDLAFGDPQWLPHPVRGVGWMARYLERFWRATRLPLRVAGVFFWLSVTSLFALIVWVTLPWSAVYWIYALLACRDLDVEARRVIKALNDGDLVQARVHLSWIVGRDTVMLEEREVVRATVETVAENMSDGVIAPLFWLAVAGPVGMAIYKAVNTLDSTAGYRNETYREFGWCSARMDDCMNFIPARLTALLISIAALLPGFSAARALRITLRDGANQPSPNSGYPEAAVAGALGVRLGGINFYRGVASGKATMGDAIHPLTRGIFAKTRVLLYACEALCVTSILGAMRWR